MANSKNTKNTNAKAPISNEEAMARVSALIAKAKRDGTIQASELTAELEKLDNNKFIINTIFKYKFKKGLLPTGNRLKNVEKLKLAGKSEWL